MVGVIKFGQDGSQTNEYDCEVFVESGKQTDFGIKGQTATETDKSQPDVSLLRP